MVNRILMEQAIRKGTLQRIKQNTRDQLHANDGRGIYRTKINNLTTNDLLYDLI
jgi:hypothetical protein